MRGDEVLHHAQALTEVGLDRARDDLTLRVGDQPTHAGELPDLHHVSGGPGVDQHRDRVGRREVRLHRLGDLASRLVPDLHKFATALVVGQEAPVELLLHPLRALLVLVENLLLVRRRNDVLDRHGHPGPGGPVEAGALERIQRGGHLDLRVALGQVVDDHGLGLLVHHVVEERVPHRKRLVEQAATERGLQRERFTADPVRRRSPVERRGGVAQPNLDLRLQCDLPRVKGHLRLGHAGERPTLADRALGQPAEVEHPGDHVKARHGQRTPGCRRQDVVARQHQDARLGLRLRGQRQVHSHLVTVEVRVERGADQRVDLDGLAFDQLWLERLDTEPVQGRCPVEQHRMLGDDLFEHIPDDRTGPLHHPLGRLDVLRVVEIDQPLHHERLEQFERHLLGQTALVQLQLRPDDDDRTAGVVDPLTEQVLAEAPLLALEHVRQRLERAVTRAGDRPATAAVVEQRVDGLLQHPLLVVDDDLRGAEVEQPLESVVTVDHPTVEVVEVGCREPTTVELHHRAQVRRNDRNAVEHHPVRGVAGVQERRDHLETLQRPGLLLPLATADRLPQ